MINKLFNNLPECKSKDLLLSLKDEKLISAIETLCKFYYVKGLTDNHKSFRHNKIEISFDIENVGRASLFLPKQLLEE